MIRVLFAAVLLPGCVIRATDPFGLGGDPEVAVGDLALEVEPTSVAAGETSILEVYDANGVADFAAAYDIRAIGDFTIVEYSVRSDSVTMVVDVAEEATGEQPIAFDFADGTAYASFRAY
jgi:hypothetical protein